MFNKVFPTSAAYIDLTQDDKSKNHQQNFIKNIRQKRFFDQIVTGDKKWIYFENPNLKKSWVLVGEVATSTVRPNCYARKNGVFGGIKENCAL